MERRGCTGDKYNRRGNIADNHFAWLVKARNHGQAEAAHAEGYMEYASFIFEYISLIFLAKTAPKQQLSIPALMGQLPIERGI